MKKFRSLVFEIFFFLWTIFITSILMPLGLTKKYAIIVGKIWSNVTIFMLWLLCGIKYKINRNDIKNINKSPHLLLVKHQSAWETIFLQKMIKINSFVVKSDLLKIPFYGWYLVNMGSIPVDRKGSVSEMRKMNQNISKALQNGRSVIIFPQGTRVKYDQNNSEVKYKLGCLDVFSKMDGKIAIFGLNSGKYWPKGFGVKNPGTIELKLIKTFEVKSENYNEIKNKLKEEIEKKIETECKILSKK